MQKAKACDGACASPIAIALTISAVPIPAAINRCMCPPCVQRPPPEPAISVRFDGLEAFLSSNRTGGHGVMDLWTATRETVFHPWSVPTNLGSLVNSSAQEQNPHITSDRQTLYVQSNRTGGFGGSDLYVITRSTH